MGGGDFNAGVLCSVVFYGIGENLTDNVSEPFFICIDNVIGLFNLQRDFPDGFCRSGQWQ